MFEEGGFGVNNDVAKSIKARRSVNTAGEGSMGSSKKTKYGLMHVLFAMLNTFSGIKECFKREAAFRQEMAIGALSAVATIMLPIPWPVGFGMVILWLLLLSAELLNSSIEEVVDLVSPEWNEHAKRAKDYASAAVFCLLVVFFGAWFAIAAALIS